MLPADARRDATTKSDGYYPLRQTLRLYAGWLLAWYGLVYAIGGYYVSRSPAFELPYLTGIFYSPLVLTFTLGAFLFLLFSGIYNHLAETNDELPWYAGLALTAVAVVIFVLYRANV